MAADQHLAGLVKGDDQTPGLARGEGDRRDLSVVAILDLTVTVAPMVTFGRGELLLLVRVAEHRFVLGTAPLLTVDTFIDNEPQPRAVALNDTYLGREGMLNNPAAFSPADINTLTP